MFCNYFICFLEIGVGQNKNRLSYTLTLPFCHSPCINPYLNQVVKVVLPSYPAVVGLQTVRLVGDVFRVQTFTVVELPFE